MSLEAFRSDRAIGPEQEMPVTMMTNGRHAAALIADPARSIILTTLLDGRALPAGELAHAAGITAQTASSHLGKLLAGGLVSMESQGRHRYYRLAGPDVASAMEALAAISPELPARKKTLTPAARRLQLARCCYDHLAGRLGVAIAGALVDRAILAIDGEGYRVTPEGRVWLLEQLAIDVGELKAGRSGVGKRCLDLTERRHHVGGPLGAALLAAWYARGWLRSLPHSREVVMSRAGVDGFAALIGLKFVPDDIA